MHIFRFSYYAINTHSLISQPNNIIGDLNIITATTLYCCCSQGCIITGCQDSNIRIFDLEGILRTTLQGHAKGVISFSWTPTSNRLLSGSWDGTARVWDLSTSSCVMVLPNHENGVHVLGLQNNTIVTVSTGESVDEKPANFKLRVWDEFNGQQIGSPIEDHGGSIRSVKAVRGLGGFITTANDGCVILRGHDGQAMGTMFHAPQEDGSPPFVLDWCVQRKQETT